MRGRRLFRKHYQNTGNGFIWRIYDAFGQVLEYGRARNYRDARDKATTSERALYHRQPGTLKRMVGG
jgi:hypothetical protein